VILKIVPKTGNEKKHVHLYTGENQPMTAKESWKAGTAILMRLSEQPVTLSKKQSETF
jgi:hypothetical protein